MKKILFILLSTISIYGQTTTGKETKFINGIRNQSSQVITDPTNLVTQGTDGTQGVVTASTYKDVLKYATASAFPLTGVVGKLYYDIATDLYYKWDGATYEEFGAGGTAPTLQEVLDAGNSATSLDGESSVVLLDYNIDGNSSVNFVLTDVIDASKRGLYDFSAEELNLTNESPTGTTIIKSINSQITLSEGNLAGTTNLQFETPIADTTIKLPAKGVGTYTIATLDDITGGSATIVTKTKAEIDTLISGNDLVPLTVYEITGVDTALYGGSTIYLQAITDNTLAVDGIGKFFNPKYNQAVSGFDVWTSTGTYTIGDKVHWGGKTWTNVNGNVGASTDIFTLDSEWTVIAFNSTDYNVAYDAIKYDYANDVIDYRNEQNSNVVSTSFSNIDDLNANPIKSFMWGNLLDSSVYVGIGYQTINNSYNENINFSGAYQTYINLNSYSRQININFKNDSYQQDIFMEGSSQSNLTFDNNSSQVFIKLINGSSQSNLTFDNGSEQSKLFLSNNSSQSNLIFDNNSSQSNLIFANDSSQSNLTFDNASLQSNLTFDNASTQLNLTETTGLYQATIAFNNYYFDRTSSSMTANENGLVFQGDLPISTTATKMIVKEDNQLKEMDIPSGSGSTNLSTTYAPTTVTIVSSSGADAEVTAVSDTQAGVVTTTQKSTWDGKQDALGFTPYNATNPSGYQTASQVQAIADAKVSDQPYDYIDWGGVLDISPSKNTVAQEFFSISNSLTNKQPLSAVLTATTASFTTADEFKLDGIATGANVGVVPNASITGATKTKITYDSKGLITSGTDATQDDIADGSTNRSYTNTEKTKLAGIATGATANSSDATLLARANHTGTQTSSTISDFNSATRAQTEAELVAGTNITITPSGTGATRQLTIASTASTPTQGAYTVLANNTASTATPTEQIFKSVAEQTYSGTITWGTTAPTTILNNTFEWQQIGKMVNLRMNISYNTAATNQQVIFTLPSGLPTPSDVTGFTGVSNVFAFGSGMMYNDIATLPASAGRYCLLRRNSANNGFEIVVTHGTAISVKTVALTIQYFAQ